MNKWLKLPVRIVLGLIVVAVLSIVTGLIMAHWRMNRTVPIALHPGTVLPGDAATLARGKYLFASRGCMDCHGHDGAGRLFLDTPDGLHIRGANLTAGANSATRNYRFDDWDRTIRHGVSPQGRPLLIMPSEDYNRLTDADLAALVAYVISLPPVDGAPARIELPLLARLAYGFGVMRDAAAKIDHAQPPELPVPEGVTVAHGGYVANMCRGCHGLTLEGGRIPGSPPDWPAAPNLTRANSRDSIWQRYPDAAALARMFRSGRRPDGSEIRIMPFDALRELNDTDVAALHLYLQTSTAGRVSSEVAVLTEQGK